jgi:N-acetylneuraminic acid mutarotase
MTRRFISTVAAIALIAASAGSGSWSNGPSLPVARSEVAVATLGNEIYVIGGYANGDVDQGLVEGLEAHGPTWRVVAPLPRGLNHLGAVGYHGKIFAFGGFSAQNNSAVADADVYDPRANRWSAIEPLPHALGSVSVAVLGNEIHLVGGRDTHSVRTHLVYDPATNRYSERTPLPVGRDHMGLVGFEGKLYAIGGRIDTPAHNTAYVDIFDPRTNGWTSGARMPAARSGMAVAAYRGKIFAIGGEQSGMAAAFTTNEAYEPATNSWSEYASLPQGRHGTGAALVNGRLYLPAGAPVPGGSLQSNTLYIFTIQ